MKYWPLTFAALCLLSIQTVHVGLPKSQKGFTFTINAQPDSVQKWILEFWASGGIDSKIVAEAEKLLIIDEVYNKIQTAWYTNLNSCRKGGGIVEGRMRFTIMLTGNQSKTEVEILPAASCNFTSVKMMNKRIDFETERIPLISSGKREGEFRDFLKLKEDQIKQ